MKFKFDPNEMRLITVSPLIAAAIAEGLATCFPLWHSTTYEGPILLRVGTYAGTQAEAKEIRDRALNPQIKDKIQRILDVRKRMPKGCVFAIANLIHTEWLTHKDREVSAVWSSRGADIYPALGSWKVNYHVWALEDIAMLQQPILCNVMGRGGLQWAPTETALAVQRQLGASKIDLVEWIRKIEQKPLPVDAFRVAVHIAANVSFYTRNVENPYDRIGQYCLGPSYPEAFKYELRDRVGVAIDELIRARLIRDQGDGFALVEEVK